MVLISPISQAGLSTYIGKFYCGENCSTISITLPISFDPTKELQYPNKNLRVWSLKEQPLFVRRLHSFYDKRAKANGVTKAGTWRSVHWQRISRQKKSPRTVTRPTMQQSRFCYYGPFHAARQGVDELRGGGSLRNPCVLSWQSRRLWRARLGSRGKTGSFSPEQIVFWPPEGQSLAACPCAAWHAEAKQPLRLRRQNLHPAPPSASTYPSTFPSITQ